MRKGYTLMELVVAGTLSMVACLGGATALQLHMKAERRAEAARHLAQVIQETDRLAAGAQAGRCGLVQAPATCDQVRMLTQGASISHKGMAQGVPYLRKHVRVENGLWRVVTEFFPKDMETVRHEMLVAF